ncbi:LPXTG-site transpeptidase (sortase) family protein [Arthrobacter sp. VKM Ac-2550]|nr:LPXTG-site transpeptidase (sortase) family protein [Arthrobacter sp. VKM Ac-2550]
MQIEKIGVSSELLDLGLQENGTLEVPPEDAGAPAGWYNGSPAPGDPGPAVLLGHVNSLSQTPGVFARLPELTKGDGISVKREDGTSVAFTVDRGEQYQKNQFPTLEVYGNTKGPELRLITCDGYNPDTGIFEDNYVVYASLAE